MSKYRSPDLTRQFCCKGGSSCGFAYKHFLSVELQFLITRNCVRFHVSHVSSMSIQNWIINTSFPCSFSPSPSSIHFTQKLRRRECVWRLLSSVDQNAKPKPVIQLEFYTRSYSNDPGTIQNSGIKPGSWWHPVLLNWPVLLVVTDTGKAPSCARSSVPVTNTGDLPTKGGTCPAQCAPEITNQLQNQVDTRVCNPECPHKHWMNLAALSKVSPPKSFQKSRWECS